MDTAMATRNPNNGPSLLNRTEFQMHCNQRSLFDGLRHKVVDFTERKLAALIRKSLNKGEVVQLTELLRKYRAGDVVIAWQRGVPMFIPVKKDR